MIYESGEDYLETILLLQRKNGSVRSIEIAAQLGYTKASISRAMSILRKAGRWDAARGPAMTAMPHIIFCTPPEVRSSHPRTLRSPAPVSRK